MKGGWRVSWQFGMGIAVGLLVTGGILWVASPPRGKAINLSPPATPSPVVVFVSGAVEKPGLYALPAGSRIQDAILAAGGPNAEGDFQTLNLAAPLLDGERFHVPSKLTPQPVQNPDSTPNTRFNSPGSTLVDPWININTASQEQLETLPGIGPTLAQRIIDYRLAYGPFTSIEAIQEVTGIGPGKYEQIKDLITIETTP